MGDRLGPDCAGALTSRSERSLLRATQKPGLGRAAAEQEGRTGQRGGETIQELGESDR